MVTEGYSKGLYSTYLYIKELNSAFDCGESLTTRLGPRCFGIQRLFLSHGHIDHIAGIPSLIGIRSVGFGNKSTPLDIYYPQGSKSIEELKRYTQTLKQPSYRLSWNPISEGSIIDMGNKKRVKAFKVEHTSDSLGYSIVETREKLKEEYIGKLGSELQALKTQGVTISQQTEKTLWAYSGDAYKVPQDMVKGAEWFFCDTTFLKKEDRDDPTHMSIDEVAEISKEWGVKHLVGMHISPRYSPAEIKKAHNELRKVFPNSFLMSPNKVEKISKEIYQSTQRDKDYDPLIKGYPH